jgi:hypothetical protein
MSLRYGGGGADWGFTSSVSWAAGDEPVAKVAIDLPPTWLAGKPRSNGPSDPAYCALWRVSLQVETQSETPLQGLVKLRYGTGTSTIQLNDLQLPIVAYVPGQCQVSLRPTIPIPLITAWGVGVTACPVSAPGKPVLRQFFNGAADFQEGAVKFTALTAANLVVGSGPVVLAVGDSIPLVSPSSLTSGSGVVEFEL